jgi:ubiquitin-protein ligase
VLQVAYTRGWTIQGVQVRMMTPVYHPTIGPQGEVAVIMTEDRDVPYGHIPFAV